MTYQLTTDGIYRMCGYRYGRDGWTPNDAQREIIGGIVRFQHHLLYTGIPENRNRLLHFISQSAHETDGFKTLEEYASGDAYEGRLDLGNTEPGDGRRYKGRGIFMLTGRYNYRTVGERIKEPLEARPDLAKVPEVSVQTAADYWHSRNINQHANEDHYDNIRRVTKAINGGYNGLEDRHAWFMAAGRIDWPLEPDVEPEDRVTLTISRESAMDLARALAAALE